MKKYADTPLGLRRNTFDELADLSRELDGLEVKSK